MSLAERIVGQCLGITAKDNVTILLYPHNIPLAEEIADECFKRGADVLLNLYTDKYYLSYLTRLSVESLRQPSVYCRALTENSTAEIWMPGTFDPTILKKIPPEKDAASSEGEAKAHWPLSKQKKVRSIYVGTSMLTEPRAKTYGFNYQKWKRMTEAAANVDYEKLAATGRKLKASLENAKTIRIRRRGGTDLTLDVSGSKWYLSDGVIDQVDIKEENFGDEVPSGSLYTAPRQNGAQGRVIFNAVTPYHGVSLRKIQLSFRDGKVTQFFTDSASRIAREEWKAGKGDKDRIALFGLGFNPKAEPGYTSNNIVAGAVSIGIGGNADIGGKNRPGYTFVDYVIGATVQADEKTVVRQGRIV
jgi:aminopeptidase